MSRFEIGGKGAHVVRVVEAMALEGRGVVVVLEGLKFPLKRNTKLRRGEHVWHVVTEAWYAPARPLTAPRPLLLRGEAQLAVGDELVVEA